MKPTTWTAVPLALATFVASSAAHADDSNAQQPSPTAPSSAPVAPAPPPPQPVTTTTPPASAPVGTTTTTSSDTSTAPAPVTATSTEPSSHDTVTLYDKHRPNTPLLFTGSAIFLGSYVTTAVYTAANTDTTDKSLYLPAVGPWLALADSDYDTTKTLLVAGSGVLQGVGLALGIASFFVPEKKAAATIQAGDVKMNVVPTSYGVGSAGIGAVGTF